MSIPHCDGDDLLSDNLTPCSHYVSVRDAVTKGPVTSKSRIAALHTFGGDLDYDVHLTNLTRVTEPAVRCQMQVSDSDGLQTFTSEDESGYHLYITYNHLTFAPKLRLECHFIDRAHPDASPYHVAILEFPFSGEDDKTVQHYSKTGGRSPHITFIANRATSTGLRKIPRSTFGLHRAERRILDCLHGLLSTPRSPIDLKLDLSVLSPEEHSDLAEIDKVLPGGSGTLLPSFFRPEYLALDGKLEEEEMKTPSELMGSEVPFPMAPLAPLETFSSAKQAALHLAYAAYHADLEVRESVKACAASTHSAAIFKVDGYSVPVLAVRLARNFSKLGDLREDLKFSFPRELRIDVTFKEDEGMDTPRTLKCVLEEVNGLPPHDAAFLILQTGGFARLIDEDKQIYKLGGSLPEFKEFTFEPDTQSTTLTAHLATAKALQHGSHEWTTHLLNQNTSQLPIVDLTCDIELAKVAKTDEWLANWRPWNDEQLELLKNIHEAKGRMVICEGIAGTGKTTLLVAVCLYFAKLRFRVCVAVPSNSNAAHIVRAINEAIEEAYPQEEASTDLDDMHSRRTVTPRSSKPVARRFLPSALAQTLDQMMEQEARGRTNAVGRDSTSTENLLSLLVQSLKDRRAGGREYAVDSAVLEEAAKGRFKLFDKTGSRRGTSIKPDKDIWQILHDHLLAERAGTFSWTDDEARGDFMDAYGFCRGHIIAATDILVTTTGSARNVDILTHWIHGPANYGIPSEGVIVVGDEAFKDTELGSWTPIIAGGLKTKGVLLLGDRLQLKPTNTTSKGKLVFGQFNEQLDISLPLRLIKHGFCSIFLKEQRRMACAISEFPNLEFYGGQLRDGPEVRGPLDRGLAETLHTIIYNSYGTYNGSRSSADTYWATKTDEQARHHYVEVDGTRRKGEDGTSKYVQEHIDVFFKYICPPLQEHFGENTSKNMMIICAYRAAQRRYREHIEMLQKAEGRSSSFYPQCHTIDSAQGQESSAVFLDISGQCKDDLGFVTDSGRCNVAMTRGKDVFWVIGGRLNAKRRENGDMPLSHFPKLKAWMVKRGRVHHIRP